MKCFLYLCFVILLCSCNRYYTYSFRMEAPEEKNDLLYEDDTIRMRFEPTADMIRIRFDNKSENGIKMQWDDISLDFDGNSKRVYHKETGLSSKNLVQPPTTITPKGYLIDALIPSDNVTFTTVGKKTVPVYRTIFPRQDNGLKKIKRDALNWKGKAINFYFPLRVNETPKNYTIRMRVTDVITSKKKPVAKASLLSVR